MATALALLTVAMAFAMVSGPGEVEATGNGEEPRLLEEWEITTYGGDEYLVLLGTKRYTTSQLDGWTNVYIVSDGNPSSLAGALENCTTIRNVVVSTDIKHLGDETFKGCTALRYVYAHGLVSIGDSAFENSGVQSVGVDSDLTMIGDHAFKGCENLKEFDLHRTRVSSIGAGAFQDSAISIADIRDVGSIHSTAFSGSDLTLQVVRPNQANAVPGVDRLYLDADRDFFKDISYSNGSVYMTMDESRFIDLFDESWNPVDYRVSRSINENVYIFTAEEGKDYSVDRRYATINFPDGIGLEDVTLEEGMTTYKLPGLDLGDLTLLHWEIEGLEGEFVQITADELAELKGMVTMVPVFDNTVLNMDHSAISNYTDVSDLMVTTTYTYGDGYPVLEDVQGYRFVGWMVNGTEYAPGESIGTFTEHTAESLWEATITYNLTYSDGHGGTVSVSSIGYGQAAVPDMSLSAEGVGIELFLGWSLDGETVLGEKDLVKMTGDVTLVPVFGERELLTVEYLVDGEGWDTAECYMGRAFTIGSDEPTSEMIFDHWSGSDGREYRTGDRFVLEGDLILDAVWRERKAYKLTFEDPGAETVTEYKIEGIPYEIIRAGEGMEDVFDHWSGSDGRDYIVGDVITDEKPLTFTAVYRERIVFTITYNNDGEEVLRETCTEGSPYEVTVKGPASEGRVFVGWTDPSGRPYANGDRIEVACDLILTAQWREPNEFSVTFTDGTGTVMVLNGTEGSEILLNAVEPEMDGKVFLCWMDGDGNEYRNGDRIVLSGNLSLEAVWRNAVFHAVTLRSGDAIIETVDVREGDTLLLDTPSVNVGAFKGWSTTDDGTVDYPAGHELKVDGDISLYAVWKLETTAPDGYDGQELPVEDDVLESEEPVGPSVPSDSGDGHEPDSGRPPLHGGTTDPPQFTDGDGPGIPEYDDMENHGGNGVGNTPDGDDENTENTTNGDGGDVYVHPTDVGPDDQPSDDGGGSITPVTMAVAVCALAGAITVVVVMLRRS